MNLVKAFLLKALSALLFALLVGVRALSRRASGAARADGVLPRRLRHRAGAADRRLAARACRRRPHRAPVRPSAARHHQHGRHVPQFRGAGAAAAGRCDRDLVRRAADHRGVCGVVPRRARAHLPLVGGRGRLRRHHRDAVALSQPRAIRGRRLGDRRGHRRRAVRAARRLHQRRLGDPDPAADRHRDHVVDRVLLLAVLRDRGPCHLAVRLDLAERNRSLRC